MKLVDTSRPDYHSYLLRLWQGRAPNTWRASLRSTATERIYHFATVEALFAFIAEQTQAGAGTARSRPTRRRSRDQVA